MAKGRGILLRLCAAQDGACFYCGRTMTLSIGNRRATIDHRVPLSRGGRHDPDNLVAACYRCNQWKGDEEEETFLARMRPRRAKS